MARPSKLSISQCSRAVELHAKNPKRYSALALAKKFGVSESSMYKVFDGSYAARPDDAPKKHANVVAPLRPAGATPSLFQRRATDRPLSALMDFDISNLEVDDLTLAAAQLIVSRSRFAQALATAN